MLAQRIGDLLKKAGARWLRDLSASPIQGAIARLAEPTEDLPDGLSKQSLQHYVRAVKQFSRWLHRERRTAEEALVGLKGYSAETDKRYERRGFTPDEMAALLAWTRQAPTRWGMTDPARAAAYLLAFASGLRANEIRTLTADSFDLASEPPTVTVEAAYSKHRRTDVQPLPADVAEALAGYLAGADGEMPFALPDKTAKALHQDMGEARAAWIGEVRTEAERRGRRADQDFLYASRLAAARVGLPFLPAWVRHGDLPGERVAPRDDGAGPAQRPSLDDEAVLARGRGRHRRRAGRPSQAGRGAGRWRRGVAGDRDGRRHA